ncbi:transcriptional regulator NrdR [Candidatus Cyanaurora vandensis]|uniref:transcriptional regulator NrdR n=1 Tax=Candidatus Cyanaurora vandensis TaxID=2714958 RepID=UPI00257EB808|nr:transcriptional regulator NrdR [Candidatus Cyanaurora vandensis]
MLCPFCHQSDSRVLESRPLQEEVRRRRECLACKQRWTTYERYEVANLMVLKRNGRREPFDRAKLTRGISLACSKTGVTLAQVEHLVDEVEIQVQDCGEIAAQELGARVLASLRTLNEVAFVRFASVYHRYRQVSDFIHDLTRTEGR